jgi:GH18 family chitinase/chitodextrinase
MKTFTKALVLSIAASTALLASPTKNELDNMTKIVGYFPEWGIYSGHNNYTPAKVPFDKVTHINYAFATIKDGVIADFDEYAANEVTHGESWDSEYKGNLGQFEKFKKDYPHLSVMVSIGGWTQSGNFHDVAATAENREKFANSVIQYIRDHKLDGVDIDWEYPGSSRQPDLQDNPNDQGTPKADASESETFTLLLKTLREHLDKASEQDGKYYQLSAAVSAAYDKIEFAQPTKYMPYLDFVNIMTYDMHGAWDSKTNHQSALYANPNFPDNLNIDDVIKKFDSYGVNKKKLIIGTPFYSRGWKNVQSDAIDPSKPGLYASASGGANGIWDGGVAAGVNPYYHILDMLNDSSFKKYYDEYAKAPYLYSEEKKEMYTYEDEQSLGEKVDYVKNNDLGGVIIWELSADKDDKLLDVIYQGFYPSGINGYGVSESSDTQNSNVSTDNTTEEENANVVSVPAWDAERVYVGGDRASYNGAIYEASWWTQGNIPGSEQWGPWKVVEGAVASTDTTTENIVVEDEVQEEVVVDDTPAQEEVVVVDNTPTQEDEQTTVVDNGTWSESTVYTGGEVVVYNGVKYKASWWTQGNIPGAEQWGPWKVVDDSEAVTPVVEEEEVVEIEEEVVIEDNDASVQSVISKESLSAKEAELTNTPAMKLVKDSIATLSNEEFEKIKPYRYDNPSNVKRVEAIVTEQDWEYLFPMRSPEYTYNNFLKAVGKFPAFCGDYSDGRDAEEICKVSLSTMFAHFTQETGGHTPNISTPEYRQGLVHVREMGWSEDMKGGYNSECSPDTWQGQTWECGVDADGDYKSYFGRGAKQLSYNYNYGPFSEAMTGDVRTLLDNPELVADTWYNLASAVFFFVYPQPPKPSMLHVIDGTWVPNEFDISNGLTNGFGVTTNIINGGVECGGSVEVAQSLNRIDYYKNFAQYLDVNVPQDEVLGCANMKQFASEGSAALPIYWEEDWSWSPATEDGRSYACKLVNYQTPYSAFKEGDYINCVEDKFDVKAQ